MSRACILTVSDTRDLNTDKSGKLIAERLQHHGVTVMARHVVIDDIVDIQQQFLTFEQLGPDLIITNGGTGIAQRDVTITALTPLLPTMIPGFGKASVNYLLRKSAPAPWHPRLKRALIIVTSSVTAYQAQPTPAKRPLTV